MSLATRRAVNVTPAGLCVSFVVVSLVPFREKVMPRLFSPQALAALDSDRALEAEDGEPQSVRDDAEPAGGSLHGGGGESYAQGGAAAP